jgi:hypothetical protein
LANWEEQAYFFTLFYAVHSPSFLILAHLFSLACMTSDLAAHPTYVRRLDLHDQVRPPVRGAA